jgi:hypothetical protein
VLKNLAALVFLCFFISGEVRSEVQSALWTNEAMEKLESKGLALSDIFPTPNGQSIGLKKNSYYLSIVEHLKKDLIFLQKSDPKLSVTMATSHRLFNGKWLESESSFFELTGIVNRADRQPFHSANNCGEMRLVYRLAYKVNEKGHVIHSRLPLTLNMVFVVPEDAAKSCSTSIKDWETFLLASKSGNFSNPQRLLGISQNGLKSIEINMQSVRWPSTTRGDLGAHAEYLLRVFRVNAGRIEHAALENTPDVQRITKTPELKKSLLNWILANIESINNGTFVAPEKYLVTKATSVSPRGLTRLSNRPWSTIFKASDFEQIDYQKLSYIKSPAALLRRLDDSSCTGCHQNRSVAGFHFLGVDRTPTSPFNSLAIPGSPHFLNDLNRRSVYITALKSGIKPDVFRPMSERATLETGVFGAHCGLGDPGFSSWTCSEGLECKSYGLEPGDKTVGQCFLAGKTSALGEPCETGSMIPNINPHKDKIKQSSTRTCKNQGVCEVNYVGFPEGMCAESCNSESKNMKCGSIALLVEFNNCLGKGLPFTKCLAENTRPAGLRACSTDMACRDDYICSGVPNTPGTCIPPYFLFQMRVDGHPRPK